ncbi:hypothetical protein [Streptomyces lunaelactis]|uniref:hypothetical protein n=1 Tax=Streptomyces lunaelactis TaxID=1535768 RepID=UPI0028158205|nr:hypothetical protein [Streptomyces lunaelactis]
MAYAHPSPALPVSAHPMANPGYGKRLAADENPCGEADFAHLPRRAAELASLIDRLPEGSAMGYKVLAATHPVHGQQACRSALRELTDAGHLRLVKEHLTLEDSSKRWVTRTYWSRIRRSDAWWAEFVRRVHGVDVTVLGRAGLARVGEADEADEPAPAPAPSSSEAYGVLARLGRTEPRMTLSAADCAALEPLAAEWLARGATHNHLSQALTAGLPSPVHSPAAIARTRLENKMPPTSTTGTVRARVNKIVMMCGGCEADETTTKLTNGLCAACREELDREPESDDTWPPVGYIPDTFRADPVECVVNHHFRADEARIAAGLPPRGRG